MDRIGEVTEAVAAYGSYLCRERVAPIPVKRRWLGYGAAVAAAAGLAVVLLIPDAPRLPELPLPPAPAAHAMAFARPSGADPLVRGRPPGRPRLAEQARRTPLQFVALPYSDERLPISQAAVVRVELPRSAMRLVGIAVEPERREDRVRADVILGADGLARAIRFVE
jgi:hypothetical protein